MVMVTVENIMLAHKFYRQLVMLSFILKQYACTCYCIFLI